jgi:SpoIID/LytB domain protein
VLSLLSATALVLASPLGARAYPSATVTISGHGYGHGMGMGQWGALGYAIGQDNGDGNWTWQQIVTHYYGGTSVVSDATDADGSATDGQTISVAMVENAGLDLLATTPPGAPPGGVSVPPSGSTAPAVRFQAAGPGAWNIYTGPGCAGPWTLTSPNWVGTPTTTSANGANQIQLCVAGGSPIVHGTLAALYNSNGQARTINLVTLGEYLDDVVPAESSPHWGTLGGAGPQGQQWGFQALEAQAVAARSYVLSTPLSYGGYADTCDSSCQSYPGIRDENALTTLAVTDTAGQVMQAAGAPLPAFTQYSASTGGYTAGGTFPPVVDNGDAVCIPGDPLGCNPNHDWTTQVPVSSITAAWPQIGTLESIEITSRNGYGDYGGRVNTMQIVGSSATVSVTGTQFALALGLMSNWFTIGGQPSGGVNGYWLAASNGAVYSFGSAGADGSMGGKPLNEPIVGMAATPNGGGYWLVASDGGIFSFGNAKFYGSMGGKPLNEPIVGIASTPDGAGYWEVASDGGIFSFGDAKFYGSMGGKPLNEPIVGIASTPDGAGYWEVASDGGIFSFGDAHFYGSTGAIQLVKPIVGMAASPDGHGYWMVASDGGVFSFGDATYQGSAAGTPTGAGTSTILGALSGLGYLIANGTGAVTSFGDAPQLGSATGVTGTQIVSGAVS